MNFCINSPQLYINFSRQEHQILLSWVAIKGFQSINPLSFFKKILIFDKKTLLNTKLN